MEIRGLTKDVAVRTLLEQAESEEQTGTLFLQGDNGIGEISLSPCSLRSRAGKTRHSLRIS